MLDRWPRIRPHPEATSDLDTTAGVVGACRRAGSHLLQNGDGVADTQVEGSQRNEDLRVADEVALDVAGEDEGQAAVDGETDAASPAAGLGRLVGQVFRPGRPGTGQISVGRVEAAVVARDLLEEG